MHSYVLTGIVAHSLGVGCSFPGRYSLRWPVGEALLPRPPPGEARVPRLLIGLAPGIVLIHARLDPLVDPDDGRLGRPLLCVLDHRPLRGAEAAQDVTDGVLVRGADADP